ncbi:copper resistance protein CopD [Pseudomonas laurentiana]|uniref:Copper resistance protein D n=1 Tax=Pseudomonas laurentiana TaxID=2364649 RepID=A0A6I5RW51_9PSED|nr:copper homeostasis membrane protein CopD [Pseudomonas laurentiana]NES11548.1 copper homeostasis membrane protein CopD [Pseudomonas laurentiana]GGU55551.1 copper resistance protein CopD [Pseudomonas laurentiana]
MDDALNITLRLALYIDLMLLFGLAAFRLYSPVTQVAPERSIPRFNALLVTGVMLGVLLSALGMLQLTKTMSGASDFTELHPHMLQMVLMETDVGHTWWLRVAALALAAIVALGAGRDSPVGQWLVMLCGAIALATLAWSGHGAMDDGYRRYLHFTSDIAHLLAAGGWLGALLAFAVLLKAKYLTAHQQLRALAQALRGFEVTGTLIVVVLVLTGVVNYLLIIGMTLEPLTNSTYGWLLSLKLILFAGMLVFAALNRFQLSPLLEASLQTGHYKSAVNALRRSMVLELSVAVLVLGLVAWLGTLSPEVELPSG